MFVGKYVPTTQGLEVVTQASGLTPQGRVGILNSTEH